MNNDHIERAISEIEAGLVHDDPAFLRRVRAVRRADTGTVIAVITLLAVGAVFMTVGLAMPSAIAWGLGLVAFIASVAVDEHHKHAMRRMP